MTKPHSSTDQTPDYDWLFSRTRSGQARGPQRSRALLDQLGLGQLGAPDQHFNSIRVIGTNGKGSTCAMLEAGLLAAGLLVGCFTSPHLERFEERIRIHGQELEVQQSAEFIQWAKQHAPNAAFFDLSLGLAASAFAKAGVQWAVMEAGVGGVSDSTQALSKVAVVALTNAALDHTPTLGRSVEQIARDKAGAARKGVPLLTTATGRALAVIQAVAQQQGAPLYTPASHPALFTLPQPPRLAGAHQLSNAQLAVATLRILGFDAGIAAALNAKHAGRLERFELGTATGGKTIWIDGAHNPHAAAALAASLPQVDTLLFGNLARKDTPATLAPLLGMAQHFIFTAPSELASDPQQLAAHYGGEAVPEPLAALDRALKLTPNGGSLLITGSLYLASAMRGELLSRAGSSQHED